MREYIQIAETFAHSVKFSDVPRLWLGPSGQVAELDEDKSHADWVRENHETVGLTPDELEACTNRIDTEPGETIFYSDLLIAFAEQHGWVRVSRDATFMTPLALSGSSLQTIRRGALWLSERGCLGNHIDVEVDTVADGMVRTQHHNLRDQRLSIFLRTGRIARKRFAESARVDERWMRGRCYDFALALKERFPEGEFVGIGVMRTAAIHVGLKVGDLILDARGALTPAQFVEGFPQCGVEDIEPAPREMLELCCGLAGFEPPYAGNRDIAQARAAVRKVFPK